jgi:hypothetical protein
MVEVYGMDLFCYGCVKVICEVMVANLKEAESCSFKSLETTEARH